MMPRILMIVGGHLHPSPNGKPIGGAARQALKLTFALRKLKVDARIVTLRHRYGDPKSEEINGIPVSYVDSLLWMLNRRGLRRLEITIRMGTLLSYLIRYRRTYEVIHVHTAATITALIGVLAGIWLNKPIILKITNSGKLNDIRCFRTRSGLPAASKLVQLLKHADRMIVLNPEAEQELLSEGFTPDQIIHIPNGVEVSRIQPKQCYKTNGPVHFLYVGRLHPSKNINILLEALATSSLQTFPWQLTLIGSGSEQESLYHQAQVLNIQDRIVFVGQVEDVTSFLQNGDIFVLPSSTEGISNALLEAMAAGLPCIGTDNAGNRSVLANAEAGVLVPVGSTLDLANALKRLSLDTDLRERLGRAARRQVDKHFDINRIAEDYRILYQEMVNKAKVT